jgi:hypothetical protein
VNDAALAGWTAAFVLPVSAAVLIVVAADPVSPLDGPVDAPRPPSLPDPFAACADREALALASWTRLLTAREAACLRAVAHAQGGEVDASLSRLLLASATGDEWIAEAESHLRDVDPTDAPIAARLAKRLGVRWRFKEAEYWARVALANDDLTTSQVTAEAWYALVVARRGLGDGDGASAAACGWLADPAAHEDSRGLAWDLCLARSGPRPSPERIWSP